MTKSDIPSPPPIVSFRDGDRGMVDICIQHPQFPYIVIPTTRRRMLYLIAQAIQCTARQEQKYGKEIEDT